MSSPRHETTLLRGCLPAERGECKEVQVLRLAPIYGAPCVSERPIGHLKHHQTAVVVIEQTEGETEWVFIKAIGGSNLGWVKRKREEGVTVHWMPYYDRGVSDMLQGIRELGVIVSLHGYFTLTDEFTKNIGNRNLKRQLRKNQYKNSVVIGLKKDHKLRDYQWRGKPVIDTLMQKFPETFFTADLCQADSLFQAAAAMLPQQQTTTVPTSFAPTPQVPQIQHAPQLPQVPRFAPVQSWQPYLEQTELPQMPQYPQPGMDMLFNPGAGREVPLFGSHQKMQVVSAGPPVMAPVPQCSPALPEHVASAKKTNHAREVEKAWDTTVQVLDSIVHEMGNKHAPNSEAMLESCMEHFRNASAKVSTTTRGQTTTTPNDVPSSGGFYYHCVSTPAPGTDASESKEEVNKEERGLSLIIRNAPSSFGKPLASIPSGGTYTRLEGEFCVGEEIWVCVTSTRLLVERGVNGAMGYVQLRGQTSFPAVGKKDARESIETMWTIFNNQVTPLSQPSIEMSARDPYREVVDEKRFANESLTGPQHKFLERLVKCKPVDSRFYTQQATPYFTPPVYNNEGEFITNARGSTYATVVADSDHCGGAESFAEKRQVMKANREQEKRWVQMRMQTRYGHACDYDDAWVQSADLNVHYLHYYDAAIMEWLDRLSAASIIVPTHSCFYADEAFWCHFNKPANLRYKTVVVLCPTSSMKKEDQLPASHGYYWKNGEQMWGKHELKEAFRDVYIISYGCEAESYLAHMSDRVQQRATSIEHSSAADDVEKIALDTQHPQVKRLRRLWYWLADAAVRLADLLHPENFASEALHDMNLWTAIDALLVYKQHQQQHNYTTPALTLLLELAEMAKGRYDSLERSCKTPVFNSLHINLFMDGWFYQSTPVQTLQNGEEVVTRSDVDVGLIVRSDPSICCKAIGLIPTGTEVTMKGGLCHAGKEWYRYVSYAGEWSRPGESRTIKAPISGFVAVRSNRILSEVGRGGMLTRVRRGTPMVVCDIVVVPPEQTNEEKEKPHVTIEANERKPRATDTLRAARLGRAQSAPLEETRIS